VTRWAPPQGHDRIGQPTADPHAPAPDTATLVAEWLATSTWEDSFTFLREHQTALATPAGRDQIRTQCGTNTILAALHLEILDMATGGVPLDAIAQFVTDIDAATAIWTTGLANGQPDIAATILRVSEALQHAPRGLAMQIAILAHLSPDDARTLSTRVATDDPNLAANVADELDTLGTRIAAEGTPIPHADHYLALLRTQTP
jgi:hypothetical protein